MPKTQSLTLRGLVGFGIGAVFSLLLYYNFIKNLLKPMRNPYLKPPALWACVCWACVPNPHSKLILALLITLN